MAPGDILLDADGNCPEGQEFIHYEVTDAGVFNGSTVLPQSPRLVSLSVATNVPRAEVA